MSEKESSISHSKKRKKLFSGEQEILLHLLEVHGIEPADDMNPGRTHIIDHSPRLKADFPLAIPLIKHEH